MTSAAAFSAVKYAGALYLIYLGIQKIRSRSAFHYDQPSDGLATNKDSLLTIFRQGVVVNVLNPKAAIFFLAFLPQFLDPDIGPMWQQLIPLSIVFVCIGFAGDSTYALIAGKLRQWLKRHPLFWQRQKYVTGGTYIALGVVAATVAPGQK